MESSRKFFKEKISDHKDFSKKKFERSYENKLKNLMRKTFTSKKISGKKIEKKRKKRRRYLGSSPPEARAQGRALPPPPARTRSLPHLQPSGYRTSPHASLALRSKARRTSQPPGRAAASSGAARPPPLLGPKLAGASQAIRSRAGRGSFPSHQIESR